MLAETKDHADWELIGKCAQNAEGKMADVLKAAYDEVENEEDTHLYVTKGWCRELWLDSLGIPSVLPPPEGSAACEDCHWRGESRADAGPTHLIRFNP